ncbi:6-phosphofructokinase 2 [Catalinimonas alkaloidigena]|uniref:6-phosphofructokinase 2 n=1 Tax=Catalinimonas alkaloidigena TaxID=1075417 RepID=A0A1G9NZR5_9BACT|nr:1-phosphofructokinase family hexose kinase [Catalinimonas alkaloidigena]SDL91783.1 6-phosphofructokinase 2 [Catalinimonas alkaloidigena]
MKKIVTLTLNPALDKSATVAELVPERKLRCDRPYFNAGGGGINVARVVRRLGGEALSLFLSGGPAGQHLEALLAQEKVPYQAIPIRGWTRENLTVVVTSTQQQYRFLMPGPQVQADEGTQVLHILRKALTGAHYLVASGSLPPGLSPDFYGKVAQLAHEQGVRFILDTSGEPLLHAARQGVYLLKPNLNELASLTGRDSIDAPTQERLARQLLEQNMCQVAVVSLGPRGAMVVTSEGIAYVAAPTVKPRGTVGAGDSLVGGLVWCLANGDALLDAVQYGVACGSAATLHAGTELCRKEDADRLFQWVRTSAVAQPASSPTFR